MTYPIDLSYSLQNGFIGKRTDFLNKLKYRNTSIDKNRDWWPVLIERYKTHFDSWYQLITKMILLHFPAVQEYPVTGKDYVQECGMVKENRVRTWCDT